MLPNGRFFFLSFNLDLVINHTQEIWKEVGCGLANLETPQHQSLGWFL